MKLLFKRQDLWIVWSWINNYIKFEPLEIVDRGSETQLQVEN